MGFDFGYEKMGFKASLIKLFGEILANFIRKSFKAFCEALNVF